MISEDESIGRRTGELLAGRYRLGRLLGEGGFGVVYEGIDTASEREVAVKILHLHLADLREVVGRFRREASTMAAIRHPNVVEVFEAGSTEDGTMFFAMERLQGRELSVLLESTGPMRVGPAVRIAMQIAEALAAVHASGIVHRDLKPDNVFLVGDAHAPLVKLLDFGVAKVVDATSHASMATRTGTAIGTAYYMSPEQAQAKKDVDARADLYSLGVILFRMLSGTHPFEDDSYPLLVVKICTESAPDLRAYRADVPPALARLIDAMLAKEPAARPSGADVVHERLAAFVDVMDEPQLLAGHDHSHPPRALRIESPLAHAPTMLGAEVEALALPKPRSSTLPILAALGLVALATVIFLLSRTTERPVAVGPSLPRPAPPSFAPMFEASSTADGYVFLNPFPRALPTFHDVAIGGPGIAAFVGRAGALYVFADRELHRLPTGTDANLRAVAWAGPDDLLVAGEGGTLVSVHAGSARALPTHVDRTLRGIALLSPREWVLVGDRGAFVHLVNERASTVDAGHEEDLLAVTAHEGDVFAVGAEGLVLRWNRREIRQETSGTRRVLRGVGACPGGDLYAVGDEGTVLRRARDGTWSTVATRSRETYSDLTCHEGRMLAAGSHGGVLVIGGSSSVRLDSGDARAIEAIDSMPGGGTWGAGANGFLVGVGPDRVLRFTRGSARTLFDLGTVAGALVAVGSDGTILRQGENGIEELRSPIGSGLSGVSAFDDASAVAVGDLGAIVAITYREARLLASPTQANLRDVVAEDGTLLAVGAEGVVVRGAEGAFVASTVPGAPNLRALAGDPSHAIGVGEGGAIVRFDGASAQPIACDVDEMLRGVFLEGDVAYAVGEEGVVIRIEGELCTVEHRGGAILYVVGPSPSGGLMAVGEDGAVLLRGPDGTWTASSIDTGGYDLLATYADERDVFLAGAGGVLLRKPRLVVPSPPP